MTKEEILQELIKLPLNERVALLEEAVLETRTALSDRDRNQARLGKKRAKLAEGAALMAAEYANDEELTALQVLNGKD